MMYVVVGTTPRSQPYLRLLGKARPVPIMLFALVPSAAAGCQTTCVAPCPLPLADAHDELDKQAQISSRLLASIKPQRTLAGKQDMAWGEINPSQRASKVLQWVVNNPAASHADILEIGASHGVGSTQILAEAIKGMIASGASPPTRRLLSLEVMPEKFVVGQNAARKKGWPSELRLASTVPPSALPRTSDTRPQSWLDGERAIAKRHMVGVLPALCSTRYFGTIFVDGGAFTGGAEWEAINQHCGHVRFVALDDTHAKTKMILADARAQPTKWEIVYEESANGSSRSTVPEARLGLPPSFRSGYRNFALLRNKQAAAAVCSPSPKNGGRNRIEARLETGALPAPSARAAVRFPAATRVLHHPPQAGSTR